MQQAENLAKNAMMKKSARIGVFNKYMNPEDPNKGRFRDPAARRSGAPKPWGT